MKRASEVPPVVESFGLASAHLIDRATHEVDKRTRLKQEGIGV